MTDKHLIALDLDGTLLTDEKKISAKTKAILHKLMEKGHEVMIATGRPYRASEVYYQELGLTTPIVNFNGAFVHHPLNNEWGMYHEPMSVEIALSIVEACKDFSFHNIIAEVMDDVYFHYHDERLIDVFSFGNPNIETGELHTILTDHPTSMLIHAEEFEVATIRQHLSDVHAEVIDHRRWAAPWHVIEIVKKGLNKAKGIDIVAKHFGIPPERIIAFGDEDNDLEMIEYAGSGIAMGNAIPSLKAIANEVILSNEEDGIGIYLEKRFSL
ncbi:Cof-type HAD-IIB family hydrolase [Bacillus sp. 2205SS5-2]|uniref:Cof-type HAD-IIB family hydrolase n=1 Tax=Bacillus sp. 2205SS5-2 TaxID=3109031 RepID=UPI0030070646